MKSLVLVALLAPAVAHADPDTDDGATTVDVVKVAPAKPKRQRLYVRLGVAYIDPLSSSSPLQLANVDGAASLAVKNGPIAGSGSTVDAATVPAAIVGYTLPYFHDRLSIETILGTPIPVKFEATGTLANKSLAPTALGLPTGVPALGPQLGEAKGVPPVVTAVYALRDADAPVLPYVGAGVAMLFAYDAHVTNPILTMAGAPDMSISPAPGLALQGGIDAKIYKRFYARIDVKFILLETHAEVDHIRVTTPDLPLFGTVEVGTAKMDVWVNPLIVQAGIGANF